MFYKLNMEQLKKYTKEWINMAEIINELNRLDRMEKNTSDPATIAEIKAERERLVELAYSGIY